MPNKKNAVVIGATGNIGKATCDILGKAGYNLDPTWLASDHPDATFIDSYKNLPSTIDIAIYLAGLNIVKNAEDFTEDEWQRVFDINLKGAFLFAQFSFSSLKKNGGGLVFISSIMTTHPYPGRLAYAAAKAGLESLTRTLAVEWGKYNIATHCIRLGHLTSLMKSTQINPALLDAVKENTPSHKLIDPYDVARYILWLAEGGIYSVSGSVIDFDPAYTINRFPIK